MPTTQNPPSIDLAMAPDRVHRQNVQVTLPTDAAIPRIDVYFLTDSTGSMGGIIAAVQAGASTILNDVQEAARQVNANVWFGVGNYRDTVDGDALFAHQVPLTDDVETVGKAIRDWTAAGGGDTPEGQLYALDRLAQPPGSSIGWREDSKRIIVWFGDAPGHDPIRSTDNPMVTYDITEDSVRAKLAWEQIFVLAISTNGQGLNADPASYSSTGRPGQGQRIATTTRGSYADGIDAGRIVSKIIELGTGEVGRLNCIRLMPETGIAPYVRVEPADGLGPFTSGAVSAVDFTLEFAGAAAWPPAVSPDPTPTLPPADRRVAVRGNVNVVIDGVPTGTVPVTILDQPECAFQVLQEAPMTAKPGETASVNIHLIAPPGRSVDPGPIIQTFDAPTGFVFASRQPSYRHYVPGGDSGNPSYRIEAGGKRLVIQSNPHVGTTARDTSPLVYTIRVTAEPDASPGTYEDGRATIGRHPGVPLSGVVIPGTPLLVSQLGSTSKRADGSYRMNVVISTSNESPFSAAGLVQRFTAPTGFAFVGGVSYGYYQAPTRPYVTGNLPTPVISDGGRTLTVTGDLHLNTDPVTDKEPVQYSFTLRALPDAAPGTRTDGRVELGPGGSFGSTTLAATVE